MKIIKKLDKLFDKYYSKQLEIQDAENPEYYLYMGKANGIKESIDLIEKDKKNIKKLLQFKANEYKLKRDFAKKNVIIKISSIFLLKQKLKMKCYY